MFIFILLDRFYLFNPLDALYIEDATDNSSYNLCDGDHNADDVEIYLGLPMSFNIGLRVNFLFN